jgi:hypothetical protein
MNAPHHSKHKVWTATMIATLALAVLVIVVTAAAFLEMTHPLASTILLIR